MYACMDCGGFLNVKEPCVHLQAANELLQDGTLDFLHGAAPWPPHLLSFTLMLGNPKAFAADKR